MNIKLFYSSQDVVGNTFDEDTFTMNMFLRVLTINKHYPLESAKTIRFQDNGYYKIENVRFSTRIQ
jgi:hypothetical protein